MTIFMLPTLLSVMFYHKNNPIDKTCFIFLSFKNLLSKSMLVGFS